jgi:hypothetical protein
MPRTLTRLTLVLVCIASVSVAYYYARYLPRLRNAEFTEQRRKTDLANSQRCNMDGRKFYADYQKDMSSVVAPDSGRLWHDPETHFDRKMNTCLVEIGWNNRTRDQFYVTEFVIDVYTNHEVISAYYTVEGGEKMPVPMGGGMEPKKYDAERDKLFNE